MRTLVLLLTTVSTVLLAGCSADPILVAEDQRIEQSEILLEALASPTPATCRRAALAMGRIQSAAYAKPLVAALGRGDLELRHAVIFALGQLALAEGPRLPRTVYAGLERYLDDRDEETVALAVEAIGKLGEPPLAHRIHPLLGHAAERVRVEAALALFRSRFVPVWRDGAEPAPSLPAPAIAALIAAFDDQAATVRRAAVYACSRYPQPEAASALAARLADDDEWVRLFAARSLGLAADPAHAAALLGALDDESERVRAEAVLALKALGAADRLPIAAGGDPSFHVRAAYASALGTTGTGAVDALRAFAADPSPTVRAAAVAALARVLGESYLGELRRLIDGEDHGLRLVAVRAAGDLGSPAREILESAAGHDDASVAAAAIEALGKIGAGASAPVLAALDSSDLARRATAVEAFGTSDAPDRIDRLRGMYDASAGDEWVEVRRTIVEVLAEDDPARAIVWNAARSDPARSVRDRALEAIRARRSDPPQVLAPPPDSSPFIGKAPREDPVVALETSKGTIEIRLLASEAPIHVASFLRRVRRGFYDGLAWHRVVTNFVVQGGDPRGDGWGGDGAMLRDEINRVRFDRGTVGMPKAGRDTGSCQIFITHVPTPHLDGNYTVFGQVVAGLEVVDRLEVADRIVSARLR